MTIARFTSCMTSPVSTLLSLLIALHMTGCGLGTEVGNGAKPGEEKESTSKKSGNSQDPAKSDSDVGSVGGSDGFDEGEDNDENSEMPAGEMPDSVTSPLPAGAYEFDVNILLNSCASPFESEYDGKISLGAVTKSGKMSKVTGEYDTEAGSWILKDAFGKVTAKVTDVDAPADHKVQVTGSDDKDIDSGYTCGEVTGNAEGDTYTYSATLSKEGKTAQISWNVLTDGDKDKLGSITIKPDTNSSTQIKFVPLKN